MSAGYFLMLMTALAPLISALASLGAMLLSWQSRRDIKEVKHATNSMKDDLVAATKLASHASGLQEGRDEAARENMKSTT